LADILGDDENAKIIRTRVCRHHEKANLLRIVGVRGPYQFFAVLKCDFGLAALILRCEFVGLVMGGIAVEVLSEEDGFQILHLHVGAFALHGIVLEKDAEAIFDRRKVVNVAFHATAVEISHYGFASEIVQIGRSSHGSLSRNGFPPDHAVGCDSNKAIALGYYVIENGIIGAGYKASAGAKS